MSEQVRNTGDDDSQEIIAAVDSALQKRGEKQLTGAQKVVLQACLREQVGQKSPSYNAMADDAGYSSKTLRTDGYKLFQTLGRIFGKKVDKANCNVRVREWHRHKADLRDMAIFGRDDDLTTLLNTIGVHGKRVICLHGPPGIGKSYLVKALFQQVMDSSRGDFDSYFSYQAVDVPTVATLYRHVLEDLGEEPSSRGTSEGAGLTHLLRTRRILLHLNNVDRLFDPHYPDGRFREESCCHEDWLQSILDRTDFQGCLLLTSRLLPRCLNDNRTNLHRHSLEPIDEEAALGLLEYASEDISLQLLRQWIPSCGHNPGILAAVVDKVSRAVRRFDDFYSVLATVFHSMDTRWETYLSQLHRQEQLILGWLLLHPHIKFEWQDTDVYVNGQRSEIDPAVLTCLYDRKLIKLDAMGHPVLASDWIKYFVTRHQTKHLVETCFEQDQVDLSPLNQFPLTVAQSPLWCRQWYERWLIRPLGSRLTEHDQPTGSWSKINRVKRLKELLIQVVEHDVLRQGHVAGTLLNIAVGLQLPFTNLPFANVTLRNVDLSTTALTDFNVRNCHFVDCVLPVRLHGKLVAALSPDGETIAVGDAEGRICCWQRQTEEGFYQLFRFTRIKNQAGQALPIRKLAFGNDSMLGIVADQRVYSWWLGEVQDPEALMTIPERATSLACFADDYIAVGLEGGDIWVKEYLKDEPLSLRVRGSEYQRGHTGPVRTLAIKPWENRVQLLSIGHGDRILLWNLQRPDASPKEDRRDRAIYYAMAFRTRGWVAAFYRDDQYCCLRLGKNSERHLPYDEPVSKFCFSANGDFFAVKKISGIDVYPIDIEQRHTIPEESFPEYMLLSNDGRWLLSIAEEYPYFVRVWDTQARKLCWELSAEPKPMNETGRPDILFQDCRGLSAAETAFWSDYGAIIP